MKLETFRNLLASRSAPIRGLQLAVFRFLRMCGLGRSRRLARPCAARCAAAAGGAGGGRFIRIDDGTCFVVSGYFEAAILDRERRLIAELSPDTYAPAQHRALRQMALHHRAADDLCVLVTPGARANYYHWMVDLMPAFRLLEAAGETELKRAALLINHSGRPYQLECLDRLGVRERAIAAETYTMYRAARLYARPLPPGRFSPDDARFLRRLFEVPEGEAQTDLYVVRGRTRRRRIVNEPEVVALMRGRGFTICDPSVLTVRDQAMQFARARLVVGFHGAGLANILFCAGGARVIELADAGYVADFYSQLASGIGLGYRRIVHAPAARRGRGGIAEAVTVDVARLEAELSCAI